MSDAPALEVRDLSFVYATPEGAPEPAPVLRHATLRVPQGAFCLLVGDTGSGKTTLLRLCKPEIAPAGRRTGEVRVLGQEVREMDVLSSARAVGYVFQSPDNQLVCDGVWHEMAFGLENLACEEGEMRRRVAETCYFLGMEPWFRCATAELSGGQRQVLALAATLAMRPSVLLLDEPTSMLDPIAGKAFLSLLFRVNRELGCTVVVATHTPAPMVDYATCALRVSVGAVEPADLASLRAEPRLLPPDVRLAAEGAGEAGGRPAAKRSAAGRERCIGLRDAWLRYSREGDWVLRGLDLSVSRGEARALVGGNGCGKSTLLGVIAGTRRLRRGRLRNGLSSSQALLPQDPKALLSRQTVGEELMEWSGTAGYDEREARDRLAGLGLGEPAIWRQHPYDLSGGQQQLVALAKLLLCDPELLLLDEPTKGLDLPARRVLARVVRDLSAQGRCVIVATHDAAFAREVCDTVSLIFDGQVACTERAAEFFRKSWLWRA